MHRASRLTLAALLGLAAGSLAACGSGPSCAAGTTLQGDTCVADVTACGAGTVLDQASGVCVPACAANEYWDGAACRPAPTCGRDTTAAETACVPTCVAGFRWSGAACVPDCAAGTVLDTQTGVCVLDPTACAAGTHYQDGSCVPDVECGPGTHAEGGACVPGLPDPDVAESADPEVPAVFDVPAPGRSVILGGTITTADTARPLPGDRFVVSAPGGTWLRLTARGDGGLRPALRIAARASGSPAGATYERLLFENGELEVSREVYLPDAADYELLVTTQDELLAFVFGGGSLPVGGADLRYVVEVTNLGTPTPLAVDALPAAPTGNLDGGKLAFYLLTAPAAGGFVGISSGAAGLPVTPGDFYPAVLAFDGAGTLLRERVSATTYEQAEVLVERPAGATTLVVQDFYLALGALRDYRLALSAVTPTACTATTCSGADLPAGGDALLRWDLAAGDLFMLGGYAPDAEGFVRCSLHDAGLELTAPEQWFDPMSVCAAHYYATAATTVSLWVREYQRQATPGLIFVPQIHATHELQHNQTYPGLGLVESPPYTFGRFGIDHVVATEGQLMFFPGFATHDGTDPWVYGQQTLTTPDFRTVGPILDPTGFGFPDFGITPLIGYARHDGHYLHFVWDEFGDPVGGTYDVSYSAVDSADLGTPTAGHPVGLSTQVLGGLRAYRFTAARDQDLTITVTPSALSGGFQPELWIMSFGAPRFEWVSYVWAPDPEAPQLGVAVHEVGPGPGQPTSVSYRSPYDGLTVIMVENASTGSVNLFQILVAVD